MRDNNVMSAEKLSHGVQELIERLRQDGVNKGRDEANRVIEEAHAHAKQILDNARIEAEKIVKKAASEAKHLENSAREAVNLAARDTVLDLKASLTRQFSKRIGAMVQDLLVDKDFLKNVILAIGADIGEEGQKQSQLEILLPADIIGLEELRRNPEKVSEGKLGQFVLASSMDMFREDVTIGVAENSTLTIRMVDDNLEINLDEAMISQLLLAHLLPRFRALLEGAIQ